jgi:hypothetical protein
VAFFVEFKRKYGSCVCFLIGPILVPSKNSWQKPEAAAFLLSQQRSSVRFSAVK